MVTARFPEWVEPMAATLTQERFTGPEWIFERKLDGIRLLAFKHGPEVQLLSRNRLPAATIPPSRAAIAELPVREVILDGEVDLGPAEPVGVPRVRHPVARRPRRDRAAARRAARAAGRRCRLRAPLHRVTAAARTRSRGSAPAAKAGKASSPSGATRPTSTAARRTG